jgi:hypothetical protein
LMLDQMYRATIDVSIVKSRSGYIRCVSTDFSASIVKANDR